MLARLILYLVLASPVVFAALWFSDNPGTARFEWLGWRVETTMVAFLPALLTVLLLLLGLDRMISSLVALPARLGQSRQSKNHDKGMSALLAALDAADVGDVAGGRRFAAEAARQLASPALASRLDRLMPRSLMPPPLAEDAVPPSRPPKARGLLARMVAPSRSATSRPAPKAPPPVEGAAADTSDDFAETMRQGAWAAARAQADAAAAAGRLPAATAARRRAVAFEAQAIEAESADPAQAAGLAREALRADPGFMPAALHVVRLEAAAGRAAEAEAALRAAWRSRPARPLLEACAGLWSNDDVAARVKRIDTLTEVNPGHPESHLAAGEAAVAAGMWGVARRHLMAVIKAAPVALAYRLMAEVEERETGGSTAAEIWRRKALEAPPEPAWRCGACGALPPEWSVICPSCGGVAAVEWSSDHRPASVMSA